MIEKGRGGGGGINLLTKPGSGSRASTGSKSSTCSSCCGSGSCSGSDLEVIAVAVVT